MFYFQHIDVLFYYLRKKGKIFSDCCVKFTTINNHFDQLIKALFSKFSTKNDLSVVSVDHAIAEYILGYLMLCNTPWVDVDFILFPIHITKDKHWVLGLLNIKDKRIYVYNSLRSAKNDRVVIDYLRSYSVLLPLFFDVLDIWKYYSDIDPSTVPFEVVMVDGLPSQNDK